jgi:hypothetical protein
MAPNYTFPVNPFCYLMLLTRKVGFKSLVTSLASQRDVPRREENGHDVLQEFDKNLRGTAIEAEFQSIRDAFATVQRRISLIEEKLDGTPEQFCRNRKK